jgi:hypothetical protein
MLAGAPASAEDEAILKSSIASVVGLEESNLRNFKVTSKAVVSSARRHRHRHRNRHRRGLLEDVAAAEADHGFEISVKMQITASLSAIDSVDDVFALKDYIESQLTGGLVDALAAEGLDVSGLEVTTQAVGAVMGAVMDEDGGLSDAGIAMLVVGPVMVLLFVALVLYRERKHATNLHKEQADRNSKLHAAEWQEASDGKGGKGGATAAAATTTIDATRLISFTSLTNLIGWVATGIGGGGEESWEDVHQFPAVSRILQQKGFNDWKYIEIFKLGEGYAFLYVIVRMILDVMLALKRAGMFTTAPSP